MEEVNVRKAEATKLREDLDAAVSKGTALESRNRELTDENQELSAENLKMERKVNDLYDQVIALNGQ